MSTTYNILADGKQVGSKAKKSVAVELAQSTRESDKVAVSVVTDKGTVVFEAAAPKKIKMSPQYTRTQDLPEGVTAPEGLRVAYVRPRRNGAILHDNESGEYRVMDLKTGKLIGQRFEVTRAAGAYLNDGVGARRKELAELRANA